MPPKKRSGASPVANGPKRGSSGGPTRRAVAAPKSAARGAEESAGAIASAIATAASASPGEGPGQQDASAPQQLLREVAARTPWVPEDDVTLLPVSGGHARTDISQLVSELSTAAVGETALQDLCVTLRGGGYELAERFCDQGALEATLPLLLAQEQQTRSRQLAAEALWLMIWDHESSTRLIEACGHGKVLKLCRDEGPNNGALACSSLRVIGETLYSEMRKAEIWSTAELEVVVEALDWALKSDTSLRPTLVANVCNIAALWVHRARGPGIVAVAPLVALIPRLLALMAECPGEGELLQQGCRVMHALASRCRYWPENIRDPALAALQQITGQYRFEPRPEIHGYSVHALNAVEALPAKPDYSLSAMD